MTRFSPETQRVLEANGWREDRHIDTSEYERVLITAGHNDCKAACEFLQRYGDLELPADAKSYETYLNTLLSEIMKIMKTIPVSLFSQVVGRTLYYIGTCYYDFMTLLMDSSGRVYRFLGTITPGGDIGGTDLFLIAASGEEAIEKLIRERQTDVDIQGEWIANGEWTAIHDGTIRFAFTGKVNPNYS